MIHAQHNGTAPFWYTDVRCALLRSLCIDRWLVTFLSVGLPRCLFVNRTWLAFAVWTVDTPFVPLCVSLSADRRRSRTHASYVACTRARAMNSVHPFIARRRRTGPENDILRSPTWMISKYLMMIIIILIIIIIIILKLIQCSNNNNNNKCFYFGP